MFSNNHGDFFYLNCLHACRSKSLLKKHERLCVDRKYGHIKVPNKGENILNYKADYKSIQTPHMKYAYLEYLLRSIKDCEPDPN